MLEHADDIRAVLVDPGSVVLADHAAVGVSHLFRDPVDRGDACRQQLTCIRP